MNVPTGPVAGRDERRAVMSAWAALARRWDLSPAERVEAFPRWTGDDAPDADTEHRIRITLEVGHRVLFPTLDDERDWVRTPERRYGWLSPLEMVSDGLPLTRRLLAYVEREFG